MNFQSGGARSKKLAVRFSLRSLAILFATICIWTAWFANRVFEQRRAIQWVEQNGGYAGYDFELDKRLVWFDHPKPPGPRWIRELIGIDWFASITYVSLMHCEINNISPLANLTNLVILDLNSTSVEDISPIENMSSLKVLYLTNTRVSDLEPLTELRRLEVLYLSKTPIADVSPLVRQNHLGLLSLDGTHVEDISALSLLPKLQELHLSRTPISDISSLPKFPMLEIVEMYDTNVSPEDIRSVQEQTPKMSILSDLP